MQEPRSTEFKPVFIVGCERSGTTLLAVLLDRHTGLAITPETHFFLRMSGHPKRARLERGATHEDLLARLGTNERIGDLGLEPEALAARFRQGPATAAGLFQAMVEGYAELRGKSRGGEKTPFHLWYVPRILEWFPGARVIGIVRDGRDVVRSVLRAPWTTDQRLRPHCLTWIHGVRAGRRFSRLYPERFRMVRYEDLLLSPEATLRAIDGFLGLPFELGQLAAAGEAGADVVPAWENEWKGKALEPLDASRIGDWRRHAGSGELLVLNTMMGKELRALGYGGVESPRAPLQRRAWNGFLNALCRCRVYRVWDRVRGR